MMLAMRCDNKNRPADCCLCGAVLVLVCRLNRLKPVSFYIEFILKLYYNKQASKPYKTILRGEVLLFQTITKLRAKPKLKLKPKTKTKVRVNVSRKRKVKTKFKAKTKLKAKVKPKTSPSPPPYNGTRHSARP